MAWMAESDLEAWMMDALETQGFAAARGSVIALDCLSVSYHCPILVSVPRDALPKLMSGELRVREAGARIAEAV